MTMKSFNQVFFISVLVIFMTGFTTVRSNNKPQPINKSIKNSSDGQLPPEVFPKAESNDSIPLHLQGELPPKIFPDEKALAKSHAALMTKETTKYNKNVTKDKEQDDTSNKTSTDNKSGKVASEIPDLLNTDFMNITTYEDGTENPGNNDTETVDGPHVINENKTHDEKASKIQRNCSLNETSEEKNSTLKNECVNNSNTTKNETIEDNSSDKNVSVTNMNAELTTESGMKQNSTVNSTSEDIETTTNLTTNDEHENVTDILETKNVTVEYNATVPTIENNTSANVTSNETVTADVQSKPDNQTINKVNETKSAPPETKEADVTTKQTSTDGSVSEIPTTTVNISENIIDHKAGSPVALAASQQHADHDHGSSGKSSVFLQPTESAAILAGVFVGIALLGYVGLLVWRRILEKRYGNREMLVNEDDFYDTNDLRNFEL